MRILVFGKTGQVGCGLSKDLAGLGTVRSVGRAEADLRDLAAIENVIQEEHPDVIINAAAYTNVDKAEDDAELARLVNARAPGVMAEMAAVKDAWLVHFSTDYVFDGEGAAPYAEDAVKNPRNVYGKTKSAGEDAIRNATDRHLILRTSWVYSNDGRNFLNTVLRLARQQSELRIVDDQVGTPTYARALSRATASMIGRLTSDRDNPDLAGVFNVTCGGATSWYGFACEILRCAGITQVSVEPILTRDFPTPAARPHYSVLDNSRLERVYGLRLPSWQASLKECMAERAVR
jgi:dTDP-4-dehydrorhamnose reductase